MTPEEQRLWQRAARGDRHAFGQLYIQHKDALYSCAYHLLGEAAAAEDVLHDVFVRFARDLQNLTVKQSIAAYLSRAVINRARDRLRERGRRPELGPPLDVSDPGQPDPLDAVEQSDARRRAVAALAALPQEQREVVVLRVFGQHRFREIAELLSVSINTAQSRFRYALTSLRHWLTEQGVQS